MERQGWTKINEFEYDHKRGWVFKYRNLAVFEAWVSPHNRERWVGDFDTLEQAQEQVENYKAI
jgi:hypothetical protein